MKVLIAYRELKSDATNQPSRVQESQKLFAKRLAPLQEQGARLQPKR